MAAPVESRPASVIPEVPPALLAKYGGRAPRYTSYPPVPAWNSAVGPGEYAEALAAAGREGATFSIYAHLPFCPQRCLYCGCNVTITRRRGAIEAYLARLEEELALVTDILGRGRRAVQVHLGGGTPNYLDDGELERLWHMLEASFDLAPDVDAAAEMDPRLGATEQLARLRSLGFRRVSFGVQDLDERVQRAIGRVQSEAMVRHLIAAARGEGFTGVNVDLIYGLPEQTPESIARTVDAVIELAPDRVACFGYAYVPAMQPHQRALERYHLPDAAERLELNRVAVARLTAAGYTWIGLDHFARPGDALAMAAAEGRLYRNFNGYTTRPGDHLLAFGMSAIGEVADCLVQNDADLAGWHRRIAGGHLATVRGHRLSEDDRRRRAAILSLMCNLALPLATAAGLERELERLLLFRDDGLVELRTNDVVVTPLGRYFLRTLCTAFDAYLPAEGTNRPMSRVV
jgi:oxygen-independent coproporphyrinogen-3 oxidase